MLKSKKSSRTSATSAQKRCIDALLSLLADVAWDDISLAQIARKAKTPLKTLQRQYKTLDDFVPLFPYYFDERAADNLENCNGSTIDCLFDLFMSRFEALQQHRRAVLALHHRTRHMPALAYQMLHPHLQSMRTIMRKANLNPKVRDSDIAAYSLLAIYALTFYTWERDQSPDMASTMAKLDQLLKKLCSIDIFAAQHTQ
ncbi:MAG: hypothetical protein RBT70_04945 [Alphaproteobacteria bacterium]|nr:hypothetical protein [Alphaproteobacteria bacterium]